MISEESKMIIIGPEKGLCGYVRQMAEDVSAAGIIYCPGEDATEDDHRIAADEVKRRRMPVVVVSSWDVYPEGIEDVIFENSRVSPDTHFGEICARAERMVSDAAHEVKVPCAILRPGMMFGTDIGGEGERMFREVIASRWFGIRKIKTLRTLVCGLDVASVAVTMIGRNGVWNVGDGRESGLIDLAAAMSSNTGYCKRPIVFPLPLAKIIARMAEIFPFVNRGWDSKHLKRKITNRVLDTTALAKELPDMKFYDTLAVIARTDESYPYESK